MRSWWLGPLVLAAACSDGADDTAAGVAPPLPEFGANPTPTVLSSRADGLDVPRDLAFHPDRPDELWVANQGDDSMVLYFGPGTGTQTAEKRVDVYANHFMEEVSSIAFGAPDNTADDHEISTVGTCQESRNTYNDTAPPNDFMGPALWPADLDLFAEVAQTGFLLGSHLDMLHQSPMCMGIAHIVGNKYWVFDGQNAALTWYDFQVPHGYGEDDHSDGLIRRYSDVVLTRVPDVPGHIDTDGSGRVFVADTGTGRILRVDPEPAAEVGSLSQFFEPLDEFTEYRGAIVDELVTGLDEPSGIAFVDGRLYVSDHGSGDLIAFDAETGAELGRVAVGAGVMGIALGPDGRIWYANGEADEVGQIVNE